MNNGRRQNLSVRMRTPSITVTGIGKISAVPDTAEIRVGVSCQEVTARKAMDFNTESMTALHAVLKEFDVAARDIQTTQFRVNPRVTELRTQSERKHNTKSTRTVIHFEVENTVRITARQIGKLGTLLDALVGAGSNRISSLSFRLDKPEELLDEARRRAVADAKRKAELLANEAGVVLGPPLSISEGVQNAPLPEFDYCYGPESFALDPPPIAEGEQELTVSIQVVYQLKQAK